MTKTEFIHWLQTARFTLRSDYECTSTEGYDYTDEDGIERLKPVCAGVVWNTATAPLPGGTPFEVSYQEFVTWDGTERQRVGDYEAHPNGLEWQSQRPTVAADDDFDDEVDKWDVDELIKEHLPGLTTIDYARLIPPLAIDTIDIDEDDPIMETITIERDSEPDLRFTGECIASATSKDPYKGGRWTNLRLYRTKGGKYICEQEGVTQYQGERDRRSGAVCTTEAEVIAFFGHGWLAKELYYEAGIKDVEEIE